MRWIVALILSVAPALAETVVANTVIRAGTLITPAMVRLDPATVPGTLNATELAVGLETRVAIYPGRPVLPGDLGPPALVVRNQIVPLIYARGGLSIQTEGRSLARAGAGERVRVMNLSSRTTVTGLVQADGSIHVEN
ncbi:flagellar basal body P-ring formation chaperone FlgA [Shimia biformata]|uniref:flagellar basal body P-ring formation chaperone FlgA n=1 Tax=Shimia biformata TaxID=1294299 RepID=UPI00195007CF|nr:flagellar basal body P-ring formation chaperone FlgA [Shimia biformata]